MGTDEEGWRRLGKRVRSERSRRWPVLKDFAAQCGLGTRVISALELGERTNFSPATIAAVEDALGWEPGSADRIRAGLRPLQRDDPQLTRLRSLWPRLSPDARRMLLDLAERALEDRR